MSMILNPNYNGPWFAKSQVHWRESRNRHTLKHFDENPLFGMFATLMNTTQESLVDAYIDGFATQIEYAMGLTDRIFWCVLRGPNNKLRIISNTGQ